MLDTLPDAADASDAEAEPGVGGRDAAGQEEALADAVACAVDGRAGADDGLDCLPDFYDRGPAHGRGRQGRVCRDLYTGGLYRSRQHMQYVRDAKEKKRKQAEVDAIRQVARPLQEA